MRSLQIDLQLPPAANFLRALSANCQVLFPKYDLVVVQSPLQKIQGDLRTQMHYPDSSSCLKVHERQGKIPAGKTLQLSLKDVLPVRMVPNRADSGTGHGLKAGLFNRSFERWHTFRARLYKL
jgi:hypothetical protein